jgi:hypothetical protein
MIDTISNPMGVSTSSGVSRKTLNFIFRSKAPHKFDGVAKAVCQASLFFAKTLAISNIQLATMFQLVATLSENGGTLNVMVRSKNIFVILVVPHLVSKTNHIEVSKVQLEYWHATMAKLHDLRARLAIDKTNVIPKVIIVDNEKGVFQLKGASA